ncbi:BIG1-domain-containing protein [Coniochaeta ligniaria NRRL 30616]|uniref:Protein BIG1 n=1 Tax=Coniochaeta ligniaria NRRL 30616 TaxID=1408157 RepID=A0A1J7IT47_9PEZI|nr:BIG1-domain-containing protein [Coniochaeta ligniaria NRRL 30616]
MRLSIASLLLSSTAAYAFSDTSPFILLSTSKLDLPQTAQLQSSASLTKSLSSLLSSCPTTRYALVSQPNLHAADIRDDSGECHMPNLCRAATASASVYTVAEVAGQLGSSSLDSLISTACASAGKTVEVTEVELRHLPALRTGLGEKEVDQRRTVLADNDYELGQLLSTLGDDYTVLLFSDPNEFKAYEPSFVEPMRTDLKRRAEGQPVYVGRRASNATDHRGLFEKYQFFTPGIFMGLIAAIVLLSILYVGLQGLSSLEVSYGAFDKEMGPAAQKKQL